MPCNCSSCFDNGDGYEEDAYCGECDSRNCECENTSSCWSPKSPLVSDKSKYVGVEIEFFCGLDRSRLARKIDDDGLGKFCYLKEDGSLEHDELNGHELNILCKEKEYRKILLRFNKLFRAIGAEVNGTCGLHIHLDMRNRDKETVFYNLVSAQDLLLKMQPISRRKNDYCRPTKYKSFREADQYYDRTAINPKAYTRHRTIEIRLHCGTTNCRKITHWISLLLRITAKRKRMKSNVDNVVALNKEIKISPSLKRYVCNRVAVFNDNAA